VNCHGCARDFTPKTSRQRYCERACRKKHEHDTRSHARHYESDLDFIGVDGEGVNRPDGRHEYVMLSVGDNTLWNDGRELTHREILPFLYGQYVPGIAFIGFFLGYDFMEWTKSLTEEDARSLWTEEGARKRKPRKQGYVQSYPVVIDRAWEIDILAKRRFRLRPHHHRGMRADPFTCHCGGTLEYTLDDDEYNVEEFTDWNSLVKTPSPKTSKGAPWMYICDTGPFWQKSFLATINPKSWPIPIVTDEEYATIKEGKNSRADVYEYGDTSYFDDMCRYNRLENEVLARVTRELNRGFLEIGVKIPLQSWFGPGQAASAWMKGNSGKKGLPYTRRELVDRVPDYARDAARRSYYGGWFEQFIHGHIPGVTYEYDINSAYPYVISRLPCLHDVARWEQGEGTPEYKRGSLYLLRVNVNGSDPFIGTMPFRDRKGRILRTHEQTGWYWKHELDAACAAGIVDTYNVLDYVGFTPCNCESPLKEVAELYELRLRVGKNTPQGIALKLLYNSIYGKFAQSIGNPMWGNPIYASLITAGCRTMILEAIASHPSKTQDVTMIATDGIYFRTPHPGLEIDGEKLGAWDVTEKHDMTQFMPGLYWDRGVRDVLERERTTGTVAEKLPLKTRGVNVRDLADSVSELDTAFTNAASRFIHSQVYDWPVFGVPVRFDIVSPGQALARNRWETVGIVHGEEHTPLCGDDCRKGRKSISSSPHTKRDAERMYIDYDVIRTSVYTRVEGQEESLPYPKKFGEDEILTEIVNQAGEQFMEWFFSNAGDTGE